MLLQDEGEAAGSRKTILHVSKREVLRPLRDQILRLSGFEVESSRAYDDSISLFRKGTYDLVLIDVEGEGGIQDAERLCSEIKSEHHWQTVAFVCNWRVALLTDCPDEILRTEFDPASFVAGVRKTIEKR